ncbi:TIGR01777 family oxidoreductase [Kineosporia sp. J2-2]|uniref:TIGR01777 family oxidoreductase n=1 Tax=Kineosporia corallincola TaxID=2835133 RepID=A0ABS5TIQ8_9ACTN|nr:TIGR01777 family oxidoreductase [Kineosporia corallincola]MBT0770989.1 TIGR01777 family oxidoreductase [Kineosporia corallincola]
MKVAVTGSHGLIGSALVERLTARGDEVVRLVRSDPSGPDEVRWDPAGGTVDLKGLEGVDGVVHLAGAGVGDHRWTAAYKREIRDSRALGTRTLVRALTTLEVPPKVLVSGSAIGYYGERGDEILTEQSGPGEGFLTDVVEVWEAEAQPAVDAGIRVAHPRTGLVMARHGGAFKQLLLLARFGLAGPLGNGRQWWSWVTLPDTLAALEYMLDTEEISGPVNMVGPEPARCVDVIRAVAKAMNRPALVPAPAFALRIVLGEFAGDVLASQRVTPARLRASGFRWEHDTLAKAAAWTVGR